jgi:hypothetical protein
VRKPEEAVLADRVETADDNEDVGGIDAKFGNGGALSVREEI